MRPESRGNTFSQPADPSGINRVQNDPQLTRTMTSMSFRAGVSISPPPTVRPLNGQLMSNRSG